MSKKITLLMVLALTICSFTYFSQKSDQPRMADRYTDRIDAYDGFSNVPNKKIPNPLFWNAPMVFEQGRTISDAEIGPEIPVTGLTGFYDYHFNGNQDHYLYRVNDTIMHAVYMLSTDSANVSNSRRVKYGFSNNDGATWTDLGEVPTIRAGFPCANATPTMEASITSHYLDGNGNLQAWINYDLQPGIGIFTGVQAPEEYIWPIQARVTNGNMLVLGTSYRGTAATDTTTVSIFNYTTHTFGPKHPLFTQATSNSNSSLAIASGPNGKAIIINNCYRETGGNFLGSRIFQFESTDNGVTWGPSVVRFNTSIIQGDTALPFGNGATDVIYDAAGNTYCAFNSLGFTGFYANSRLYVQKNTDVPVIVAGGPLSPVNPIPEAMTTTANAQGFMGSLDHPCLSISADQQYIFVSYSVLFQNDTLNGFNKAHVFYSWAPLSNISQWHAPVQVSLSGPTSNDERYASIATTSPLLGSFVTIYMTYQKDTQPGSHAFNDGAPVSRSWLVFRKITDATLIGVGNNQQIVRQYQLFQNYPNPFNPTTRIDFNLVKSSFVEIRVYDILGRVVKTLVNGVQSAGSHNIQLDASQFASGIYFYTIKATEQSSGNTFTDTKKMMLIK